MKEIKVKEWKFRQEQDKASRYDIWFRISRRTDDIAERPLVEDGCVYLNAEVVGESAKAYKVVIFNGFFGNCDKDWTCWMPKSACEVM